MKKALTIVAIAAVAGLIGPTIARAGTGTGNGQTGRLTGKNGAATYVDGTFGPTTCNETQHPNFDEISCNAETPNPAVAGTVINGPWCSDFVGGGCGTVTLRVSGDGKHYSGKATY